MRPRSSSSLIDSRTAAWRLLVTLIIMTLGSSCGYVVSVVLPAVQAEFGVSRSEASLPYTALMMGYAIGGVVMGRLTDRLGIVIPQMVGAAGVLTGFVWAGLSTNIQSFAIAHGLLIGLLGMSATFAPLISDTSLWWKKYRGIAVAICASGSYLAGAIWPPITQRYIELFGWRESYITLGLFCGIGMALLAFFMRKPPPNQPIDTSTASTSQSPVTTNDKKPFGIDPVPAQWLLFVAGVACCVAMAMPQVHIVAYCADLGFGPARGAEMLALMLGCGIISRLFFGWVCDHIGGVKTLLLGSILQGLALLMFLPFRGLVSLYIVSAMFGLFQGGIVPSYAIIIREHFPTNQSGRLVGFVIMGTLLGMALGGWMSGKIFDITGSYHAAILNGIGWNLLNVCIATWMFWRITRGTTPQPPWSRRLQS